MNFYMLCACMRLCFLDIRVRCCCWTWGCLSTLSKWFTCNYVHTNTRTWRGGGGVFLHVCLLVYVYASVLLDIHMKCLS